MIELLNALRCRIWNPHEALRLPETSTNAMCAELGTLPRDSLNRVAGRMHTEVRLSDDRGTATTLSW